MAYITLDKNRFFNNLDIIANKTKSVDKIAVVLKDNAYGHGLFEIASMAKEYGITKAIVRTNDEALKIEDYFKYILVLNAISTTASKKIRYTINDIKSIEKFAKGTLVELKVDTGMHRNGISIDELEEAFDKIKKSNLILEAVFTHHRSADELTSEWFWQNENFKEVKKRAKELSEKFGFGELRFHSANSASTFRCNGFDEDESMVRVGIAIYGCMDDLEPILSLYADKISSRELKKGLRVGYGGVETLTQDSVVSNYDFGYGDGFLRILSKGYKTPQNKKLVGRISMDNSSFLADEDRILIFDDASKVAKDANTISYEVLTSLKASIKREVI
ncbi:MAG: alanine racemase [Epsilonproteobacteria bacterium]|nr:alanine racemase [Campylobacterota bacterium]